MRKVKILLAMSLLGTTFAQAQNQQGLPGNLVPDSSTIKADTLKGTFVYLDSTDAIRVKQGHVITQTVKLVFIGQNGAKVPTEQWGSLSETPYIDRKVLDESSIIFFKPKIQK